MRKITLGWADKGETKMPSMAGSEGHEPLTHKTTWLSLPFPHSQMKSRRLARKEEAQL